MNFNYLTESDWQEFHRKFPGAMAYLDRCSLIGERKALKKEWNQLQKNIYSWDSNNSKRISWIEARLKELDEWAKGAGIE